MSVRTQIDRINGEVSEQAALLAQLDAAVDALPDADGGGGGGEDVNGNCTIIIKPAGSTNHYIYAEQISTDGTVTFFMSRAYTESDITVNARCGMTIPIMASNINGAECTAGEVVYVKAGYGIAYKVPNTPGETVQITLAK